ncbi:UNVERIFIED_CONTAM: hypothetical protein FKN15_058426 [Acipenser sinensis]
MMTQMKAQNSKRPAEGGKKAPAPLPGTSEGRKGEKAPEVAGPSAPPESAPGEKAAEWTVVARRIKKAAARSTGEAKRGETKPTAAPSGGGSGGVPDKETPSTAPPARQGGKAAQKTKHLTPGGEEREAAGGMLQEREAAGGELPVAATRLGTASGSIRGKRKAQARLPTCARKCTRTGLTVGVPGEAKEGPPKPKRPPQRPPSAGNEGPGPRNATEAAEPMEEAPAERPKGREDPTRAERALRVDPLPYTQQTSEAGPDSTIKGPAAAEVAEGAQEGPLKEQHILTCSEEAYQQVIRNKSAFLNDVWNTNMDASDESASDMSFSSSDSNCRQRQVKGIKGPYPSMLIPCFDVVDGYVPDYMHAVLLGVVKRMASLWFYSCYHEKSCARGEKATEWTTVARRKKKAAVRSTGAAEKGATKPATAPSGGGSVGVPEKGTPSTAPPARQGGKALRKTKHLIPTEDEVRSAAGGVLPAAVAGQGTASGSIRGKRKAQARLPTCARKCTRLGLLVGVPGGAKEGPPKPKRPPRRPPSAGNEGPGPRAATEGGKDPSPEAVQGSAEEAEPMEEAPAENQKGREEPARAEIALRADPLPVSKETSDAGPDSTTEGPAAAGVAEGAQEGPPKEQLPRAPPSSDGDTGPEPCVAEEGAAEPAPGPEGGKEPPLPEQELPRAPEAGVGSADNAEPMQAPPAEGPEGEEELPLPEQELPRAPEASMGSADNAEPMQETLAEGPEGGKEPPLPEQELPRAPEAGVGSADDAGPMQAAPAEGSEGGEEPSLPEQELPGLPRQAWAPRKMRSPCRLPRLRGRRGELSPPTQNKICLRLPSLAAARVPALVLLRRGMKKHPLRQTRALRSPRLLWSPERGREGKSQRGQKVVPSRQIPSPKCNGAKKPVPRGRFQSPRGRRRSP